MNTVTAGQIRWRLAVLLLGVLGGLMELTWVHTLGLNCEFRPGDGLKIVQNCASWTEIFISYPENQVDLISGVVFIGGFLSVAAGLLAPWKPLAAAVALLVVAALNLGAIVPWWLGPSHATPALISSFLFTTVPLLMAAALAKWGS